MNRIVLDTNVVLDYLSTRRPCHQEAVDLLYYCFEEGECEPVMPNSCIKDAYFILYRQYHNEPVIRARLDDFRRVVTCEPLSNEVLDAAFSSDEPDFEDGIVRATAELLGATAIVTRDSEAYRGSKVPAMTAREYLMKFADF